MSNTNFGGPLITYGKMPAVPGSIPETNEVSGPSPFYQAIGIPDVRYQFNKDNVLPGKMRGFVMGGQIQAIDAVPQTLSTTAVIATTAVAGAGTVALAATSSKAIASNTPVVGSNSTTGVATACLTLDPGFQTVNINATATVTIGAGTANRFPIGMWFYIGGTAGAAGTFTRVTANAGLSTTTTITVSPAPSNTNATAPVMTTNLLHPYAFGASAPTSVFPWIEGGALGYFDPTQALSRSLTAVSSNAGDTTQTITVRGFDVYLNPMAETIAMNGTTPVAGVKCWKHISSITASAAFTGNLSVGTADTFGLAIRSDFFEHTRIYMNATLITATTGWTAGDQATATATTGDVRGKYAVQTASNNARRLTVYQDIAPWNQVNADPPTSGSPTLAAPMFGVTQFTS